jgi:hypothetical protein
MGSWERELAGSARVAWVRPRQGPTHDETKHGRRFGRSPERGSIGQIVSSLAPSRSVFDTYP